MRCDVAVIGAGAAGIAAAVASADAGAKVVLVERHGFTGGLATTALVGTICGLFYRYPSIARYAVEGFAREFADAVQVASQTHAVRFGEGLHFLPYRPAAFHQVAVNRLQQAGVQLLLHGTVSGITLNRGQIRELRIQTQMQVLNLYPAAIASARVIGTCLSTGYAAGCLAAEFSDTGIWQTAIKKIRQRQIAAHSAVSSYS